MLVFDLLINGRPIASAGREDLCVLSTTLSAVGKLGPTSQGATKRTQGIEITCNLGGMTSRAEEPKNLHLTWHRAELQAGDEISIRIRDADSADTPLD